MSARRASTSRRRAARSTATAVGAAGVTGLATVLAFAPLAHAAPAAGSSAAASGAPSGTPSHTPGSTSSGRTSSTNRPLAPDFGAQKYRVGVQVKSGAYVPAGTTTAGTTLTITETGPSIQPGGTVTTTCTTEASTATAGDTATYCLAPQLTARARALRDAARSAHPDLTVRPTPGDAPSDELFTALPGDTVTITQTTVEPNLRTDPSTATIPPCTETIAGFCTVGESTDVLTTDEIFDDPGLPPTAVDDAATVRSGSSVTIDALANDTTFGAPVTTASITSRPTHGTATLLVPATAATARAVAVTRPTIRYTSTAPFVGVDHLRYSFSTANGTATALVTITVSAPPPTAVNDSATTPEATAVTIAVLDNDDAHGGGALTLKSVGTPAHGTVRIDGTSAVYTPAQSFTGTDTFTYVTATAYGTATAVVTVTVTGTAALAATGSDDARLVGIGALLVLTGGAASVAGRRRRRLPIG